MARQQDSVWLVAISACAVATLGIGAYGIGTGTMSVTLVAAGMISLGLGLVLSQLRSFFQQEDDAEQRMIQRMDSQRVDRLEQQQRDWQYSQDSIAQQLAALQSEAMSGNAAVSRGLDEIRGAHASLAERIEALVSRPPQIQPAYVTPPAPPAQSYAPPAAMMAEAAPVLRPTIEEAPTQFTPTPQDDTPFGDKLSLSLEPVVDLYSSQTAHYRLVATMLNDRGQEVAPEMFAHHVAQLGQRALLDTFIIRETVGILGQLRQRDPNLCVLVSIGAATLADRAHLQTILGYIKSAPDVAQGLVLDVNHGVLASLPDASLEGLATLARNGVVLALSQVSIAGVDLAALSKLNVRYVCLAAASLALGTRTPAAVTGFIQAARALRIQTIITQVTEPHALGDIMRAARLACGPAFAPPRRLKRTPPENDALSAAA